MAEKATLARPYARAAFAYAQEHQALALWSDALTLLASIVSDAQLQRLLDHPQMTTTQLVDLIAAVAQDSGAKALDAAIRRLLDTLAYYRRLKLLPEIAALFLMLRAEVENNAEVQVVSAVPLDATQQQRLAAALQKRLQRAVRLHCSVDATMLGGAVIRSGDFVIDGSLKTRLDQLAVQLQQ